MHNLVHEKQSLKAGEGRIHSRQTSGFHGMQGLARSGALTHAATLGLLASDGAALRP